MQVLHKPAPTSEKMISKTLTIFLLGLLLAVVAHGEPGLVDREDAAPEPARLLKGSKGGKSAKSKSIVRRYLKGSKGGKSGKGCKGSKGGESRHLIDCNN